jgi:GNAT superfamily N-acetyltransferase
VLAQGDKDLYENRLPETAYQRTWQRIQQGDGFLARYARSEGRLLDITHTLFHTNVWSDDVCFLQDLFAAENARGHGVAQALIKRVEQSASDRGGAR